MLNTVNCFFNCAADHLELNEQLREILLTPNRVVRVAVCVDCVGELELTRIEKRIEVVLKC